MSILHCFYDVDRIPPYWNIKDKEKKIIFVRSILPWNFQKKARHRWKVVKNSRFRRQTVCTVFINLLDWSKPRLSADPVDLDWASYLAIVNVNGRQCNIESSALCSLRAPPLLFKPNESAIFLSHLLPPFWLAPNTRSKRSKKMIYASRTRHFFR